MKTLTVTGRAGNNSHAWPFYSTAFGARARDVVLLDVDFTSIEARVLSATRGGKSIMSRLLADNLWQERLAERRRRAQDGQAHVARAITELLTSYQR